MVVEQTVHMKIAELKLKEKDRLRIMAIENYLCENLEGKFEGIEFLSEKFKISPTKLKKDFKLHYGKSLFSYYQYQQMLLANKLLKKEDIRIKELAIRMGYENAGKFSQAFKKHNSVLPSKSVKQ
jgi:AraC-like DNA-binding protein